MKYSEWRRRSVRSIWHPYTDITAFEQSEFPVIERAQGSYLYDVEGNALLDGIASWWCINLGHSHPKMIEAIQQQAAQLQHTLLGGLSHPRAIELAERLEQITPDGLGHTLFAADGSMAVEAALKIALQYWVNKGETGRTRFIALQDGYHGDSLGAVGAGYVEQFHAPFREAIRPALCAVSPHCNHCPYQCKPESCSLPCFESMEQLVHQHHAECAAVIIEPLCQAAAGMRVYPAEYLRWLRLLCDEYNLLLIADEIAVGFGRTGALFACETAGIAPDILCLGKGLTGGMLPLSATLVTGAIYDTFRRNNGADRTFYHGTTFCGNPIASAAALAALDIYENEQVLHQVERSSVRLRDGMRSTAEALGDSPLRALGMIAAIEITEEAGGTARARAVVKRARDLGLFLRPLGSNIYLWPPLNVSEEDLGRMLEILAQAVSDTGEQEPQPSGGTAETFLD